MAAAVQRAAFSERLAARLVADAVATARDALGGLSLALYLQGALALAGAIARLVRQAGNAARGSPPGLVLVLFLR